MPIRSNKVIFVPFCILCQSVKATGLSKHFPAMVEPLVKLLNGYKVNIVQIPCPEMLGEGLVREPHDISYYERPDFLKLCRELALAQADVIERFITDGFDVVGLMGIERSPSCSLGLVRRGGEIVPGIGVFMREMTENLEKRNLDVFHLSMDLDKLDMALGTIVTRMLEMDDE